MQPCMCHLFTCANPFADQCPSNIEDEFLYADPKENTNITLPPNSLKDPNTDEVIGEQFDFKCASGYRLEISHDNEKSFIPKPPKASIKYECTYKEGTYQSSIKKNGIPRCKLSKLCTCN